MFLFAFLFCDFPRRLTISFRAWPVYTLFPSIHEPFPRILGVTKESSYVEHNTEQYKHPSELPSLPKNLSLHVMPLTQQDSLSFQHMLCMC